MKKLICMLLVCASLLLCLSGCRTANSQDSTEDLPNFRWIREESGLIDYTISGDTIQIRYAMCFENNSENATSIRYLTAHFQRSHLRGWMKAEKSYRGVLENGDDTLIIKSGERITVAYVFTGEYLGGEVNEKLYMIDFICLQEWDHSHEWDYE